jgi:hypothetical protein
LKFKKQPTQKEQNSIIHWEPMNILIFFINIICYENGNNFEYPEGAGGAWASDPEGMKTWVPR